jgi:hypothetical protein
MMNNPAYHLPSRKLDFSASQLSGLDLDEQREVVLHWFYERFEHPDNRTPYDSGEGGYIWIWGGPYEPDDELSSEFDGLVDADLLQEIISELESESLEWGPAESPEDYDDSYIEDLASIISPHDVFQNSMQTNKDLMTVSMRSDLLQKHLQLLYANMITVLETYLSTTFVGIVLSDEKHKRKFVQTTPEFEKEKIPVSEIFNHYDSIDQRIHKYLSEVMWHNLAKVKLMYRASLCVSFPEDLSDLLKAVSIRHDIVHRNGREKDGSEHLITVEQLRDLETGITSLVGAIEAAVIPLRA